MIVQLAGLPGTGKSTLAAELVHRLAGHALLLDKDHVRHALFGPQHTLYTRGQDDFCVHTMSGPPPGTSTAPPARIPPPTATSSYTSASTPTPSRSPIPNCA
ncbi:MAG: AAA family ATPase [Pseudonocardiaceae bacterium]